MRGGQVGTGWNSSAGDWLKSASAARLTRIPRAPFRSVPVHPAALRGAAATFGACKAGACVCDHACHDFHCWPMHNEGGSALVPGWAAKVQVDCRSCAMSEVLCPAGLWTSAAPSPFTCAPCRRLEETSPALVHSAPPHNPPRPGLYSPPLAHRTALVHSAPTRPGPLTPPHPHPHSAPIPHLPTSPLCDPIAEPPNVPVGHSTHSAASPK